MDRNMWQGADSDLGFAQTALISGSCVKQSKLRARARETTLQGIVDSELRRLSAHDMSFG